jgi:hypothetical protein
MKHGSKTDGLIKKAGAEENRNGKDVEQEGMKRTEGAFTTE